MGDGIDLGYDESGIEDNPDTRSKEDQSCDKSGKKREREEEQEEVSSVEASPKKIRQSDSERTEHMFQLKNLTKLTAQVHTTLGRVCSHQ